MRNYYIIALNGKRNFMAPIHPNTEIRRNRVALLKELWAIKAKALCGLIRLTTLYDKKKPKTFKVMGITPKMSINLNFGKMKTTTLIISLFSLFIFYRYFLRESVNFKGGKNCCR